MKADIVLVEGAWFGDKFIDGVSIYINGGLCFWTKDATAFARKIMGLQRFGYDIIWPV